MKRHRLGDKWGGQDIYMKDLATGVESPVTTAPDMQDWPDVYGNTVVWSDHRNGNWDIYMKNLSTGVESPITTYWTDQWDAVAIHGKTIVWEDVREPDYWENIYMATLQ